MKARRRRLPPPLLAAMLCVAAGQAWADAVALINVNQLSPRYRQINAGAIAAARAAGVELVIFNANDVAAAQERAIETYVINGVDAIGVVPIEPGLLVDDIAWAREQGVPVIAIDTPIPDSVAAAYVGADNGQAARDLVAQMLGTATRGASPPATVAVFGSDAGGIGERRRAGLSVALATAAGGVEMLVDSGPVDGLETARARIEALIEAHGEIGAICATDPLALAGAIAAVVDLGVVGDVAVYGWGLSASVVQAIDSGVVAAVVLDDGYRAGAATVETAVKLIDGVPATAVVEVRSTIVNAGNVDAYRRLFD
ncbi:MAG: substrate-binding domain-containing protein [Alphaproteobacteria bacterium]